MNIQKEILSIIHGQDFIILPEIGAFIFEYSKPYFNGENQLVESKKTLRFENIITKDPDNKLINYLSKSLSIPNNFTEIEYQDFLRGFKKEILLKDKYDWEGFGMFFKGQSGLIEFFPERNQLVDKVTHAVQPIKTFQEKAPVVTPDYIPKKIKTRQEKLIKNINTGSNQTNWFKYFLFLLPIVLLSTGLAYNFLKNSPNKRSIQTLVEEIDSLDKAEKNIPEINNQDTNIRKPLASKNIVTEKSSSISSSNKDIENTKSNYTINIGIFKVRENVDNLATYLAENGIPAKVRPSGGKYKVYVSAESEEQAKEFVDKIEQLTGERPVYQ